MKALIISVCVVSLLWIAGCGGGLIKISGLTDQPEGIESIPGILSAKAISSSEIQLNWSDPDEEGQDVFYIYQSTQPGEQQLDTADYVLSEETRSYLVHGLAANSEYCFIVSEGDPSNGIFTNESCATTTSVPGKSQSLGPKNGLYMVGGPPILEWSAVDHADSYQIQLSKNAGFTDIAVDDLVEVPVKVSVVKAATESMSYQPDVLEPWSYWWRVRACSGENCSEWADNVYRLYYQHAPGDVDGDGIAEIVISSYSHNGGVGRVYVFRGREVWPSEDIDAAIADRIIDGESGDDVGEPNDNISVSYLSGTLDINGDGYADIVIARYAPSELKVFLGGPDFFDTTSGTVADADVTIDGGGQTFCSSTIGGDINGDGFGDIIGQQCYYPDDQYYGRVLIYFGGSTFGNTELLTIDDVDISIEGYSFLYETFGISVLADVDNDGRLDVIGTEGDWTGDSMWYGRASFFYSDETFLSSSALTVDDAVSYIEGLTGMDGFYMDNAGDWNNDGKTDLIGGAYEDYLAYYTVGLLYRGGSTIPLMEGSILATDADITLRALDEGDIFVRTTMVGDFDSDGIDDLGIDEMYASPTGVGSHGIYYLYQGGDLFNTTGELGLEAPSFKIYGGGTGDRFGYVAGRNTMDVNGDGIGDLHFSGWTYTDSCVEPDVSYGARGAVVIFLGRDDFFEYHQEQGTQWSCEADIRIIGEASGDRLGTISTMIP